MLGNPMKRRDFLRGTVAAAPAAALMAHFGVSKAFADDMAAELARIGQEDADLAQIEGLFDVEVGGERKTRVAMPSETFLERKAVWYSVANVAKVWADELGRQHPHLEKVKLKDTCRRMARAIDDDFRTAEVPQDSKKVVVEVPRLIERFGGEFELRAGLENKTSILAGSVYRVGFIGTDFELETAADMKEALMKGRESQGWTPLSA